MGIFMRFGRIGTFLCSTVTKRDILNLRKRSDIRVSGSFLYHYLRPLTPFMTVTVEYRDLRIVELEPPVVFSVLDVSKGIR